MNLHDLIRSLYEQARDREALVPPEEPDSIFAQDAQDLREAAGILQAWEEELSRAAASPDGICVLCGHYDEDITGPHCWDCTYGNCRFRYSPPPVQTKLF